MPEGHLSASGCDGQASIAMRTRKHGWWHPKRQETGTLKARIRRVQVPLGEAVRPSRLPASQLPHMWQLSEGQQYRDSNSRIWGIEHHLMITGVEELLLKLLPSD
ncbi:protein p13 MTCP-1 isoform X2 [Elgaria multicarinata webbii]|uniref:protein p13 MTCP-1 isoform X2 n=1 Tax=Elgaria multicarinata webbii TaxID=159646 RepID=UPI002FCCE13E